MRLDTPEQLLQEMVRTLFNAENQLILALPRVATRVNDPALRAALLNHLEETRVHSQRLQDIGRVLGFEVGGATCLGIQGILKEGDEVLGYGGDPALVDAAIIAAGRRVEHYEIASYTALGELARRSPGPGIVELVEATLNEERSADRTLEVISGDVGTASTHGSRTGTA